MTDSVACIPPHLAAENRISVIPAANIIIGDKTYIEGVNLSAAEAYALIKKDPDNFVTSAITPGLILDEYRKLSKETRNILVITISSTLSAVFQSVELAADTFREESPDTIIRITDSKTCAGAEGLIVLAVARAAAQGMDIEQLIAMAGHLRQRTGGLMFLDTLRYIYRTGRMSKTASRIASILNIKPINRVSDDGTVEFVDRVRKRSDGFKKLIELIKKDAASESLHFMVSHANAPEIAQTFCEQLKGEFNCLSLIISDYSPVMGYGAGPGGLFVGFQSEPDL